jgi:hypothetical protein
VSDGLLTDTQPFVVAVSSDPPFPHTVTGDVFVSEGVSAGRYTPVHIDLLTTGNSYNLYTNGPVPPVYGHYTIAVNGLDDEAVNVYAWDDTQYGSGSATLSSSGGTVVDITFTAPRQTNTTVQVTSHAAGAQEYLGTTFSAIAEVAAVGGQGCVAELFSTHPAILGLSAGESAAHDLGDLDGTTSTSWEIDALDIGASNLIVFAVCSNEQADIAHLDSTMVADITVIDSANHAPVLDPIGDRQVVAGEMLEFALTYTDTDGDQVDCEASNLPMGGLFETSTCEFSWVPNYDQIGPHEGITFTITDDGVPPLADAESIVITVLIPEGIPTVTAWGLVALAILMLTAGTLVVVARQGQRA